MRIVHVEDYFDPKAGYQINELISASKFFDDEIFLITSKDMSPFHKQVNLDDDIEFEHKTGVKIFRLDNHLKISSRIIMRNLNKKIDELNPDVVFLHGIGDFKDLQLWGKKKKYKIIRDCHMSWVASKNNFRALYYIAFKLFFSTIINNSNKYEVVYALGQEEYEYLKKIGIEDHKIDYLLHGYNDSTMYYDELERIEIRKYYNFSNEDIVISYIGKFNDYKRPDILLDIIDILGKDYIKTKKIKLLFLGSKDNNYMDKFNYKVDKIKNKIEIVIDDAKPFSELRKFYSASDIVVFPKETTLSSIHAQVCGCPVVMERHNSNVERVLHKPNLYNIDDLTEASMILKKIIKNKDYIKSSSNNNKLMAREYKNQIIKFKQRVSLN